MMQFPVSCNKCAYRDPCGGLGAVQAQLFGCFLLQEHKDCDFTCPCRPAEFRARLREVGGLSQREWRRLELPRLAMPPHVPIIRHGYGRRAL
ncbi:MAG: hypothetical protein ABL886_02670, partial [Rhodoglobus sp.]